MNLFLKIHRIIWCEEADFRVRSQRWVEMGRYVELENCCLTCIAVVKTEIRTPSTSKQIGKLTATQNKDKESWNG